MFEAYHNSAIFSMLLAMLPLLSAFVIIARKSYQSETMMALLGISFSSFILDMLYAVVWNGSDQSPMVENLILLLHFGFILLALRNLLNKPAHKQFIPLFFFITASILGTYLLTVGANQNHPLVQGALCLFIVGTGMTIIWNLFRKYPIEILKTNLFWVSSGLIFYYCQYIFIHLIGQYYFGEEQDFVFYETIIMLTSKSIMYIFLLAGAIMPRGKTIVSATSKLQRPYFISGTKSGM